MDHLENRHSFAAVIGDIKDSRHLENRKEVQDRLQRVMDRLNRKYKEDIVSKFLITLGDEFQGLLCGGKNILSMINEIKMEMYPVRLRFGVRSPQTSRRKWRWARTVPAITAHEKPLKCSRSGRKRTGRCRRISVLRWMRQTAGKRYS